jgi:hypothetical protein
VQAGPTLPTEEPVHSLTGWLRSLSDSDLLEALRRRPDLALPAPVDLPTLASRASVRTSLSRALDALDAFTLRVIEVIVAIGPDTDVATVTDWFRPQDHSAVEGALGQLRRGLLIWQEQERIHSVGALAEVLGRYPAGLGRRAHELFSSVNDISLSQLLRQLRLPPATQPNSGRAAAAQILASAPAAIGASSPAQLAILRRLADGPPVGTLRNAAGAAGMPRPGTDQDPNTPARELVAAGLLVPTDRDTVELPREIALLLREVPAGPVRPTPPEIATRDREPSVIDRGGATTVMETVRITGVLLDTIAEGPPSLLRSGGIGVRDLRRLARQLDIAESVTGVLLEVAFEAGLLASSSGMEAVYLPTTEFDVWQRRSVAERWVSLASAWLGMTRLPALIGQRDERDRTIAPLSAEVERHSAPALRLQLLGLLTALAPGRTPVSTADVLDRLAYDSPRRASANRDVAASALEEAAAIGLTGYGAITGYSRALLDGAVNGAPRGEHNAADALAVTLPEPVGEFLLQPDLTAVVPGPPTTELQRLLRATAELESAGGASVYRVSPTSLRRALDGGMSGSDLTQFFSAYSRTPVPQALQYMINDVASQHGRLRAGTATSYLRCDDESLLDRAAADARLDALNLTRIAPTVLISPAGISSVLERLRAAGFAPAAESGDGVIVTLASDAARLPGRPHSRIARVRQTTVDDHQLAEVVSRIRSSERIASAVRRSTSRVSQEVPGVTSASILELLRTAVRESRTIALGYVDDTGTGSQQTLMPISVGGGMVRGHSPEDSRLRSFPLQRITTVSLLDL